MLFLQGILELSRPGMKLNYQTLQIRGTVLIYRGYNVIHGTASYKVDDYMYMIYMIYIIIRYLHCHPNAK